MAVKYGVEGWGNVNEYANEVRAKINKEDREGKEGGRKEMRRREGRLERSWGGEERG